MTTINIPPKSEWPKLSIAQLYGVKADLMSRYYSMRQINATFAPQFLKFHDEIEALIRQKESAPPAEDQD